MRKLVEDLIAKGYRPLPVRKGKKFCALKGWPELVLEPFDAPGVGLNLAGCAMVDIDVEDTDTADALLALAPGNPPFRFRRNSGRVAALFRCDVDHLRLSTPKYKDEEDADARVEIKMGKGEFMFGWGNHPTGAELEWDPVDLPAREDLPYLSREEVENLTERFEQELFSRYGAPVAAGSTVDGFQTAHDLTWNMHFEGAGTLRELVDAGCDEWVHLTPWRPDSDSQAGHLFWGSEVDGPVLYDFVTHTKHFLASDQDPEGEEIDYEALEGARGLLQPTEATEQALGEQDADAKFDLEQAEKSHELVYCYADGKIYNEKRPMRAGIARANQWPHLKTDDVRQEVEYLLKSGRWCDNVMWDPRHPYDVFFAEHGDWYMNLFRMPVYPPSDRDPKPFFDAVRYIIPDEEDQEAFINWVAARIQNPSRRNYATVLYSAEFGTGKGTLWAFIKALWGNLANKADMRRLVDKGYEDELVRKIFVLFDEVQQSDSRGRTRTSAMDFLKDRIEPQLDAPRHMHKFGASLAPEVNAASFLINTNHVDALALEDGDRRFHLIQCREIRMDREYGEELEAWRQDPANIAALWHALATRNLEGYSGTTPPDSPLKQRMTDANRSLEEILATEFLEAAEAHGGAYFTTTLQKWLDFQGHPEMKSKVVFYIKRKGLARKGKRARADTKNPSSVATTWCVNSVAHAEDPTATARRFESHIRGLSMEMEDV